MVVHTIAISGAADYKLEVLARANGGLSFFVHDQSDSITDAIVAIMDHSYG